MRGCRSAISIRPLQDFLHRESASGLICLVAAMLGLVIANTPVQNAYFKTLDLKFVDIDFQVGDINFDLKLTVLKIINYFLMTLFFFIVGLEIKRELTSGHLATLRSALAPFMAAVGGMALPAAIYLLIAGSQAPSGWAVPVATDIALAVGALALIGQRVAPALRTFLLGLAVIDDIGAILIIALIYSTGINFSWIAAGALSIISIIIVKMLGAKSIYIYVILGAALWYCLYRSGVHPTLAGVILGLLTPNLPKEDKGYSDLEDGSLSVIEWLEAKIHPWSSFVIVPIFAFANTGVEISSEMLSQVWLSPIAWGIFLGLVIGKPAGIFLAVYIARKANASDYPEGSSSASLLATGSAAGIGFTVAIFIAQLAFSDSTLQDLAVLAVVAASIVSGLLSWLLFKFFVKTPSLN